MGKGKLKKQLNKLDYYCLKKFGFSVFDKDIQKMIGVKEDLSANLRAASVARKMSFVLNDKKLSQYLTKVLLCIKPSS